ncbi:MAG: minor capsid protein, partial [Ruminococcus sp.]|nr:minor capsid protein [Ruminococcus sp.]
MSEIFHFPGISYVCPNFSVHIALDRYSKRFDDAQQWLGDRVLEDCKPFMPLLTGSLQQRSYVADGGRKVVFPGPYGRFQYMGKVMVDPDTGSPWARKGVKKVVTDRPLTYS